MMLDQEAKRYDVEGMHVDLNSKLESIVTGIKKEQKAIMNDEDRQLRNLDRLEYMNKYLQEDFVLTRESMKEAQEIKEKSAQEMRAFAEQNEDELKELEQEVREMQE